MGILNLAYWQDLFSTQVDGWSESKGSFLGLAIVLFAKYVLMLQKNLLILLPWKWRQQTTEDPADGVMSYTASTRGNKSIGIITLIQAG